MRLESDTINVIALAFVGVLALLASALLNVSSLPSLWR